MPLSNAHHNGSLPMQLKINTVHLTITIWFSISNRVVLISTLGRKVIDARFSLQTTRITTRSTRHNSLFKNFPQDSFMKCILGMRGGWPRSLRFFGGLHEQHEGMTGYPHLRPLSERPHASNHGRKNVPSSGHRTPFVPNPGSYCAILF